MVNCDKIFSDENVNRQEPKNRSGADSVHGYFERFSVNSVPESSIIPLPMHKILLLNYEEDIT